MVVLMVGTRKVDLRSVKKRETRIGIELIIGIMIQLKEQCNGVRQGGGGWLGFAFDVPFH